MPSALDASGNIYVAGTSNNGTDEDMIARKYDANGDLDLTWGDADSGMVTWDGSGGEFGFGITHDSSGNIYLAGSRWNGADGDAIIRKYDANGDLTTDWGDADSGMITFHGGFNDRVNGITLDASNNLYVAGYAGNGSNFDFRVWKYDANGDLTTDWGDADSGMVTYDGGTASDQAYAITLDTSGNIYVAGFAHNGTDDNFIVRKYDSSGDLDTTWGDADSGVVTYDAGNGEDQAYAITLDASNNIYVTGRSSNGTDNDFIARKYDANGDLTTDWGDADSGMVTYDGGSGDVAYGVTLDSSGNMYVTGGSNNGTDLDFIVRKYDANGKLVDNPWLDANWLNRTRISFDNSLQVTDDLDDFPVLVTLNTTNLPGLTLSALEGADVRFTEATTGTELKYEVDTWNEGTNTATIWVKVPTITAGSATDYIYVYYDHSGTATYDQTATDEQDVWSANHVGVWHLDEEAAGTGNPGLYEDSTATPANGTDDVSATGQDGKIDAGQEFNASVTTDNVSLGTPGKLDLTSTNFTIEAWIFPEVQTAQYPVIYADGTWRLSLGIGQVSNTDKLEVWIDDSNDYASDSDVNYGEWNHVVLTWDGSNLNFYLNGGADGSRAASAYTNPGVKQIGNADGGAQGYFKGNIDEVRISTTDRTADWIKASFLSQNGAFAFNDFGNVESALGDVSAADMAAPVASITRDDPDPVVGTTATFSVDFSEDVTNVTTGDFTLATTGGVTANILSVGDAGDGDASTYTVTVDSIVGPGTLGLDFAANDIIDAVGIAADTTPLTDEVYAIKAAPEVDLDTGTGGVDYAFTFTEGDSATTLVDATVSVSDADDTTLVNVTLDTGGVVDGADEQLSIGDLSFALDAADFTDTTVDIGGNTHTVGWVNATGIATVTLNSGEMTLAQAQIALLASAYQHIDPVNPTGGNRTFDVRVNDGDADSLVATTTVTVAPVNEPAVMDLDADDSSGSTGADFDTSFTEDGGAVSIVDTDATLSDVDSANLVSLLVTITNQLDGTAETLAATTGATSISASYDSGTGILTLSGSDTVANYQQVLRTVTYDNSSQDPNLTDRSITFVASDGSDDSNVGTTSVVMNSINDPAVLDLDADDSSGSSGADFNTDFVTGLGQILITDADATLIDVDSVNLVSLTVTITNQLDGANETLSADTTGTSIVAAYDSGTGILSLTGSDTVLNYQQVLRTVTYDNVAVSPDMTDRSITFIANDGTDDSSLATTAVNMDVPVPFGHLQLSTADDVVAPSGAPGLASWTDGEGIQFGGPGLNYEPGVTAGTFSSQFNLDDFPAGNDVKLNAIHHVTTDITVGSDNAIDLFVGDLLLSTKDSETLTSTNTLAVEKKDVFVFRPDTPGDYSSGTFIMLLDMIWRTKSGR